MAFKIQRGTVSRPQRIVIYAPEGLGKSTLASKLDNALFLDFEKGTHHLDVARWPEMPANGAAYKEPTLAETEAVLKDLIQDNQGFKVLVIDTIDWLEELVIADVCKTHKKAGLEDFGYGKGHVYLAERFGGLLSLIDKCAQKMDIICLAHSYVRKFEPPDGAGAYDRYSLKLGKQVAPLVAEWCDALLFGNYKTQVKERDDGLKSTYKGVGGKERILYTNHSAFADAKHRHGLNDQEPWSADVLRRMVTRTVAPVIIPATVGASERADGSQGEPASPSSLGHETKPEPTPQQVAIEKAPAEAPQLNAKAVPSSADDTIPGLTPLDPVYVKLASENAAAANALLLDRKEIKPGQTWADVSPEYVVRVLRNPAGWLVQANKVLEGAK